MSLGGPIPKGTLAKLHDQAHTNVIAPLLLFVLEGTEPAMLGQAGLLVKAAMQA